MLYHTEKNKIHGIICISVVITFCFESTTVSTNEVDSKAILPSSLSNQRAANLSLTVARLKGQKSLKLFPSPNASFTCFVIHIRVKTPGMIITSLCSGGPGNHRKALLKHEIRRGISSPQWSQLITNQLPPSLRAPHVIFCLCRIQKQGQRDPKMEQLPGSLQAVGLCRKIYGQCPWVTQSLIHIAYHFTLRKILLSEDIPSYSQQILEFSMLHLFTLFCNCLTSCLAINGMIPRGSNVAIIFMSSWPLHAKYFPSKVGHNVSVSRVWTIDWWGEIPMR